MRSWLIQRGSFQKNKKGKYLFETQFELSNKKESFKILKVPFHFRSNVDRFRAIGSRARTSTSSTSTTGRCRMSSFKWDQVFEWDSKNRLQMLTQMVFTQPVFFNPNCLLCVIKIWVPSWHTGLQAPDRRYPSWVLDQVRLSLLAYTYSVWVPQLNADSTKSNATTK
jgi:hypothetical protein